MNYIDWISFGVGMVVVLAAIVLIIGSCKDYMKKKKGGSVENS